MEALVAPVTNITLDIERFVSNQVGALPLPFPGMDKSGAPVCEFYVRSSCVKATACPFRHVRGDRTVVCKHWLRGLCKKGDGCEFLHEYDKTKMPECYFYTRFNACHNKECPFLHIDPESKIKDCPWYDRGFCRHGPLCRHRHVRRVLCLNYLAGFCPAGPNCPEAHPKFEIPVPPDADQRAAKKVVITCHYCGEVGHKVSGCAKIPPELKEQTLASMGFTGSGDFKVYQGYNQGFGYHRPYGRPNMQRSDHPPRNRDGVPGGFGGGVGDGGGGGGGGGEKRPHRNLDEIVCYKCGEKGHFANRCTKGHLAFLSLPQQTL